MKRNYLPQPAWTWAFMLPLLPLLLFVSGAHRNSTPEANRLSVKNVPVLCYTPADSRLPTDLEEITINDNRKPAGEWRNGIYYLHLEAREGYWYPESKEGRPVKIKAFAEAGRPLQVPGPLIRVPEGTEIRLSLRNGIKGPITLFGISSRLYRPGKNKDSIVVKQGETKEIAFNAGAPGTFLYTAKDQADTVTPPQVAVPFLNSQLYGAFIIDPVAEKVNRNERIFMVGMCGIGGGSDSILTKYVINGLSWPHTERLRYQLGEKVDWRVINASVLGHPMHLHGSPFVVNSLVFAAKDSIIPEEKRKEAVTQNLVPMNRMRMTWVPKKAGNWLFHCHLLDHTLPASFFKEGMLEDHSGMTTQTHARNGMGGLVMGIDVLPGEKKAGKPLPDTRPERNLTLLVGEQPDNAFRNPSGKGFQLFEKGAPSADQYRIPGPPIILIKDQPVAIKVVNKLKEATAIHWHGLELDSYYDGVAGWSNDGKKLAPLLQPGDTFVVHLQPPRAGTFMYHTHMHSRQLLDGLYGPLIVVNPGESFNPQHDKLFLISQGGASMKFTRHWLTGFSNVHYLLNGSNKPPEMQLKKGVKYRFRVMNISAQQNSYFTSAQSGFFISLKRDDGKPVNWKSIDKDGMSNAALNEPGSADHQRAAPGTTHDFEFTPDKTGNYVFEAIMDQKVEVRQTIKVND